MGAYAVIALVLAIGIPGVAWAQGAPVQPMLGGSPGFTSTNPGVVSSGAPQSLTPLAPSQRITSLGTAAALTVPAGATMAVITADLGTANVRWRDDTTNPTATVGNELASGSTLIYTGNLSTIRFIQEGSSPATPILNVSFYQ